MPFNIVIAAFYMFLGSDPPFLSSIPQPHSLNSILAFKLGMWLQNMLLLDANRRGREDGPNGWYEHLQKVLNEKV